MNATAPVGILGTGLIGASVGLRARELGWRVLGCDIDDAAEQAALACGALDEIAPREAIYERCTTIVLAMHVRGTLKEIARMQAHRPARASLVLDVASVKAPIASAAAGLDYFIASHPMAGAERSGAPAARATLFSDRPWLYVRSGSRALNERAVQFIGSLGARPIAIDEQVHDKAVALTSHVPQMMATLFAGRLQEREPLENPTPYCGPTALELLRLSRSSIAMWRDIFQANGENVGAELRVLASEFERAADALERGDTAYVDAAFARAQETQNLQK